MSSTSKRPNEITITIPLTITISLGAPDQAEADVQRESVGFSAFSLAPLSQTSFSWQAALSCALASKLAYNGQSDVESWRAAWGLQSLKFLEAVDTQCFVAMGSDAVLVAFRGTENAADWIADFNAFRVTRPYGKVHRGFYHAFNDVRALLEAELASIGNRKLVLSGHSLGGALATVAAAEWLESGSFQPSTVYTYGQPRVGNGTFKAWLDNKLGARFSRFVNADDIVTRVPPGYSHVGNLFHFDASGVVQESLADAEVHGGELRPLTEAEFDNLRAQLLLQRQGESINLESISLNAQLSEAVGLEGVIPGIQNHAIDNYIELIARNQ